MLPSGSLPVLAEGPVANDIYAQVFVKSLEYINDVPWKNSRFDGVLSQIAPAMQEAVAGGNIEEALSDGQRSIERLLSR